MAIQVLQRIFQFRTCSLDIARTTIAGAGFGPACCTTSASAPRPCNLRVTREDYRRQIRGLRMVLEGKKDKLIREMEKQMKAAAAEKQFEKAARLRDEIDALRKLELRGDVDKDVQPEVFHIDPKKGLRGLAKMLGFSKVPRTIEGVDIAHLGGEDTVASLVSFIDGLPFKPGYRRFKIRSVEGVDDFASIREVVARRFRRLHDEESAFPDILLIDGGKGQLNAALEAFQLLEHRAAGLDLAGQARGRDLSARRSGADPPEPALGGPAAACNTSATRPTASRSITITCCGERNCKKNRMNADSADNSAQSAF